LNNQVSKVDVIHVHVSVNEAFYILQGEDVFGITGYGGQVVIADPHNNLSIAYLTSHLSIYELGDDPRFLDVQRGVYNKLEKYLERKEKSQT